MNGAQINFSEISTHIITPEMYEAVHIINQSLQAVIDKLDRLQALEVLSPTVAEIRRLTARQLRSEINATVTIDLHTRECKEAFLFQQQRLALETSLNPALPQQPEIVVLAAHVSGDQQSTN